ncbi:hypothetical protein LEMLEM_LOCUS11560 [Lemmus lemmus]
MGSVKPVATQKQGDCCKEVCSSKATEHSALVILYIIVPAASTPTTLLNTGHSLHYCSCIQYTHLLLAHWYQRLKGTDWRIHPMEVASYQLWRMLGLHL